MGTKKETEQVFDKDTAVHFVRKDSKWASIAFVGILLLIFAAATYVSQAFAYLPILINALVLSFERVWGMYLLCAAITIPVGIKIAKSTKAYEPILAVVQVVASIPATILLPAIVAVLFLLPFWNELVALAIIFLSMVWYILFSVISGMRSIPREFTDIGKIFRQKWYQTWKDIYLPAILPEFITGSITAIGGAWNALIIAEYFSVQAAAGNQIVLSQVGNGIGKLLDLAVFSGNLPLIGMTVASMVLMVVIINKFLWQRLYKYVTARYKIEV